MDLSKYPHLEERTQTVDKQQREEIRDGVKYPQTINITTTRELLTSKDKTNRIEKITVVTETSTKLPDGTSEVKRQTKWSASEVGKPTPDAHLEGFTPIGEPKTVTAEANELIKEGAHVVTRHTTVETTTQEYRNAKGQKQVRQDIKTTYEDTLPDGSVMTSMKEVIRILGQLKM